MDRQILYTNKAPQAIGPYSQAVKAGQFVYISGQIPINPQTGELITADIKDETRQVLDNFKAIVEEAGTSLQNVIKTTIFIKNMEQFSLINEVYATYFPEKPPARACVEVSRLPKDVNVEIEGVALIK